MTDSVVLNVENHVATITLNRPQQMNSLNAELRRELLQSLHDVNDNPDVRVVVLTATGRAFCAGQDLREHLENLNNLGGAQALAEVVPQEYSPLAMAIADLNKPIIAAVNGVAAGAGASLTFLADYRILTASASYNTAFAGIALSADTGASWSLQRLVGPAKALELLYSPRTIDAEESLELGLASEVVPDEDFSERVTELAQRFAQGPTVAYAAIRQSLAYSASHTLADSLAFEATQMSRTGGTADHQAAVQAFVAKERPQFEGR